MFCQNFFFEKSCRIPKISRKFSTLHALSQILTTMKKILLLAFAGVFTLHAYSQNYQTVNSSEVKLFEFNASTIRGYRIDSVMVDGVDSLLYPSRSIQKIDQGWECFDPLGPSMLGDYIRILPDGDNLFFNQNGDTIRIETRVQINDS